ncbi:MAG: SRPBCC family protein [Burkholderiaceae bacterium]
MLKTILIVIVLLVASVLIFAATKPDDFRVERSATIKAPPSKISALIDDFHQWALWSPWEKIDPTMKRTFSGPASGVGSAYAWTGDGKVGAGRMEIVEANASSNAPSKIRIKLDFIKPLEGHNTATYTLVPEGDATRVTWAMDGPRPYIAKLMSVFFSMDKMIGGEFEKGLADMKAVAEK